MTDELLSKYGDNVCSHAIEVKILNTTGRYPLPDDSILREKKLVGIFIAGNADNDRKAPASGNDIVSDAALRNSYLTLVDVNKQLIADHPLTDIAITDYDRQHRKIAISSLTPDKSFIQVADTSLISAGQSFLLHFIYLNC